MGDTFYIRSICKSHVNEYPYFVNIHMRTYGGEFVLACYLLGNKQQIQFRKYFLSNQKNSNKFMQIRV